MKFLCRLCVPALLAALLVLPAQATAEVPHTVQAGETLWSIAAASNFTTRALAAANGLPEDAQVVVGTTIQIPSEAEAAAALATRGRARRTATGADTLHPCWAPTRSSRATRCRGSPRPAASRLARSRG